MRPKSCTELRVIISQLYDYLKVHDDLLDYESAAVNKAIRYYLPDGKSRVVLTPPNTRLQFHDGFTFRVLGEFIPYYD